MRFLVDECTGPAISNWLKTLGHEVICVYDECRGMEDTDILEKAFRENYILITNDKDFGTLIFKQQLQHHGIILLRLSSNSYIYYLFKRYGL